MKGVFSVDIIKDSYKSIKERRNNASVSLGRLAAGLSNKKWETGTERRRH